MRTVATSPAFQSLDSDLSKSNGAIKPLETPFWWNTSGRDLANMMHEIGYPEDVQRNFLTFYHDKICPLLGNRPDENSSKAGVGWDGNPLEYSWEMKGSKKKQSVRFVVDLTELRPADPVSPLNFDNTQAIVDILAKSAPNFDDTWFQEVKKAFVYSHLNPEEQKALIAKAGQSTSVIVGFDIHQKSASVGGLPVLGKVYFPPCFLAAAQGITRWQAVRQTIRSLSGVQELPNLLQACETINDYLSDKPEAWQMGTRYLATDLVKPRDARFKVYMRCFGTTFDEIWDYYTLGGRIPDLDGDKEKFRDLMDMVSGTTYAAVRKTDSMEMSTYTSATGKLTAIYFSLSPESPYPAPKLCVYPANFAPNDLVVAKGLDAWLEKYGWGSKEDKKSMQEQVTNVFTHRKLEERTGIFTFLGIGRKEGATNEDLSMQVYVTPELYVDQRD